jgi:adenosylcobinamide kinase/adenosylcobinamide-phosphate guanylyltransferase
MNNLLMKHEDVHCAEVQIAALTHAIEAADCPVLLVSNEVGTGIVPENKLARVYRDLIGTVNQAVAKSADTVVWVVAGIAVTIK